jgi:photosystem II stability/assembly factor-like uncharacterized protein
VGTPYTTNEIAGLTYGNGLFAAVPYAYDTVLGSAAGPDILYTTAYWTSHPLPTQAYMSTIGYGDGIFIVEGEFGDEAIFTSTNLIGWSPCVASANPYVHSSAINSAVSYGANNFVSVGGSTIISSSAVLPLQWTLRYDTIASLGNDDTLAAVAYGNGLWVAVGGQAYAGDGPHNSPPLVLTSGSLINVASNSSGTHLNLSGVVECPKCGTGPHIPLVAIGDLGTILFSTNGTTWLPVSSGTTNFLRAATATDSGMFLAVGDNGTVLSSLDGITWHTIAAGLTNSLSGIASGDGLDVAVGGGAVLVSTNGTNWTPRAFLSTNSLLSVTFGDGLFEAISSDGLLFLSTNGVTWSTNTPSLPGVSGQLTSISFSGGQFTAVDSQQNILVSADGLYWSVLLAASGNGSITVNGAVILNGTLVMVGDEGSIQTAQFPVSGTGTDSDLNAVAYNGEVYVAVGADGTIVKSADGSAWTAPTNYFITDHNLTGVTYGNGLFVGVGKSAWVVASSDGDNWNSSSSGATVADLYGITFGDGMFVAVGDSGVIITSTDGVNWTVASSGVTDDLSAVTYGNGRFVAVGDDSQSTVTSTDGVNWVAGGNGFGSYVQGVAFGNGIYVGVDYYGEIFTSSDGANWTQQAATSIELYAVAYAGGTFLASGADGAVFVSPDGTNWTQLQTDTTENLLGVVGTSSQFVIVGTDGISLTANLAGLATVSANTQWSLVDSPLNSNLNGAANNGPVYVIVADDGALIATNATNWAESGAALNGYNNAVAWGNGVFASVDYYGDVFTSPDGKTWTQRADADITLYAIAFGGGTFVATGDSGEVFTSSDNIHWSPHSTGLIGSLRGIVYANGNFVVVADDGTIAASSNGGSWSLRQPTMSSALYGITYGHGLYVAVGDDGTIVTSPNGTNWLLQTNSPISANSLQSVAWGDNEFIAVGDGGWTVRSDDGTNWVSSSSATVSDLYSITFANGSFLATGANGTIMETAPLPPLQLGPIALTSSGAIQVEMSGAGNSTYQIQVSTDLVNWTPLTSVTLNAGAGEFIDSDAASGTQPHRFYRAVIAP